MFPSLEWNVRPFFFGGGGGGLMVERRLHIVGQVRNLGGDALENVIQELVPC